MRSLGMERCLCVFFHTSIWFFFVLKQNLELLKKVMSRVTPIKSASVNLHAALTVTTIEQAWASLALTLFHAISFCSIATTQSSGVIRAFRERPFFSVEIFHCKYQAHSQPHIPSRTTAEKQIPSRTGYITESRGCDLLIGPTYQGSSCPGWLLVDKRGEGFVFS